MCVMVTDRLSPTLSTLSGTPVTVMVCAAQSLLVKFNLAGLTVAMLESPLATFTVTSPVG